MLFKSVEISDRTGKSYMTEVEVNTDATHHIQTVFKVPINSKCPYQIITGEANYWSGTVSGNFADNQSKPCDEENKYGEYDLTNDTFRFEFVEWMHNGLPKTLKLANNFLIQAGIDAEITLDPESTIDDERTKITFTWHQLDIRQ